MANVLVDDQSLRDIADAIRSKNGSVQKYLPSEMPQEIMNIQAGSVIVPDGNADNPVRFYDYDGTLLYSYTLEEIAGMTELPELPAHPGLAADGWNWTLAEIRMHNREVIVGAHYTTSDGSTRLYVELKEHLLHPYVVYRQSVSEGILIDWGDGSEPECHTGSGSSTDIIADHEYASPGKYVVRFISKDGCKLYLYGSASYGGYIWSQNDRSGGKNYCYTSTVYKIEIGNNVAELGVYCFEAFFNLKSVSMPRYIEKLSNGTFERCYNLRFLTYPRSSSTVMNQRNFSECRKLERVSLYFNMSRIYMYSFEACISLGEIVLPDAITGLDNSVFTDCISLKKVCFPNGMTNVPAYLLRNCYCVEEVNIPLSCTTIKEYVFEYCYNLKEIIIPERVVSIGNYAFSQCTGMRHYYFMPQVPPTIGTYTFYHIPEECVIHVPRGCLEAYQEAAYWVNYADKMVEME